MSDVGDRVEFHPGAGGGADRHGIAVETGGQYPERLSADRRFGGQRALDGRFEHAQARLTPPPITKVVTSRSPTVTRIARATAAPALSYTASASPSPPAAASATRRAVAFRRSAPRSGR